MNGSDESIDRRLAAVIDSCRVPIDARCRLLLERLVDDGIERFATEADPRRSDEAVDNLRRIVDDMVQQMRILRFDALHEPNLLCAVERLAPAWPFC